MYLVHYAIYLRFSVHISDKVKIGFSSLNLPIVLVESYINVIGAGARTSLFSLSFSCTTSKSILRHLRAADGYFCGTFDQRRGFLRDQSKDHANSYFSGDSSLSFTSIKTSGQFSSVLLCEGTGERLRAVLSRPLRLDGRLKKKSRRK